MTQSAAPYGQVNYGNPQGAGAQTTPGNSSGAWNNYNSAVKAGTGTADLLNPAIDPNHKTDQNTGTAYQGPNAPPTNTAANPYAMNDPAYEYGGYSGGQQQYDAQYQAQANAAAQRTAPTIQYGQANAAAQAAQGTMGQQQGALGYMAGDIGAQQQAAQGYGSLLSQLNDQAQGKGPNPAALQAQQTTNAGIAAQMAMANSTRGSQGAGMAQLQAQQQGASMQAQNAANTGVLNANQEIAAQQQIAGALAGQQSALQGVTGAQQAQATQYGQMTGQNQAEQQLAAQQAQAQATVQMQQQQANDALSTYYQGALANVNTEQLQANEGARGQANQIGIAQAPLQQQMIGSLAQAGGSLLGMSDIRAKSDVQPAGGQAPQPYGASYGAPQGSPQPPPQQQGGTRFDLNANGQAQTLPQAAPQQGVMMGAHYGQLPALNRPPDARAPHQLPALNMPPPAQANGAIMSDARAKRDAHDVGLAKGVALQSQLQHAFGQNYVPPKSPGAPAEEGLSYSGGIYRGNPYGAPPQQSELQSAFGDAYVAPKPEPMASNDAAAVMSDKELKERPYGQVSRPGGHTIADDYLDTLARSASTYRYKDPRHEPTDTPTGGEYGGIMAQDLERVPRLGPQLVKNGPEGKHLEWGANLSAALMGLGRNAERTDALERHVYGEVRHGHTG